MLCALYCGSHGVLRLSLQVLCEVYSTNSAVSVEPQELLSLILYKLVDAVPEVQHTFFACFSASSASCDLNPCASVQACVCFLIWRGRSWV